MHRRSRTEVDPPIESGSPPTFRTKRLPHASPPQQRLGIVAAGKMRRVCEWSGQTRHAIRIEGPLGRHGVGLTDEGGSSRAEGHTISSASARRRCKSAFEYSLRSRQTVSSDERRVQVVDTAARTRRRGSEEWSETGQSKPGIHMSPMRRPTKVIGSWMSSQFSFW